MRQRRYMTFLSFSLSTLGINLEVCGFSFQWQFTHSNEEYETPYWILEVPRWRLHISASQFTVYYADPKYGYPPIYMTTHEVRIIKHV